MTTSDEQAPATNPNKALWEKGDFTRVAAAMRESGEAMVDSLGVAEGMDVLDLACGDGTTAIPSAARGANVLGVDIAQPGRRGQRPRPAAGLANIRFQEGDASNLHDLDDDSFDLVVSIFGAMFAPRPFGRGEGDGARHQARRPHRDGQLDPQRSRRSSPRS